MGVAAYNRGSALIRRRYEILRRAEIYLEYGQLAVPGCTTATFDPNPPKRDRWGDPIL